MVNLEMMLIIVIEKVSKIFCFKGDFFFVNILK